MEWNNEKQARLDALRAAELTGTLDEASKAELATLIESLEAEERERLAPALAHMQAEQAALRQQVQESEAENEQLVILAAQQEQLLADARGDCYATCNVVTRPFGKHISTSQANRCRWRRNGWFHFQRLCWCLTFHYEADEIVQEVV